MLQRFLDPATLASISSLDLVAKTVVDGFVAGMHRSSSRYGCRGASRIRLNSASTFRRSFPVGFRTGKRGSDAPPDPRIQGRNLCRTAPSFKRSRY